MESGDVLRLYKHLLNCDTAVFTERTTGTDFCNQRESFKIKSRRIRWADHVTSMGETRNVYKTSVGNPVGKRPLRRPRRRWEAIRMNVREIGWEGVNWTR
jgi:hypothetical protein